MIGIDRYQHVNPLRGAVADARDIQSSLSGMGAKDVVTLIDAAANRARLIGELDRLVARSRKGDLVIITLAGHGSKEDERVKGSSTDGTDEVFLLADFDPKTKAGSTERVLNHEFHHYIKALEAAGAQVIFVADTCYGGGLAREVAIGSADVSYRQVPRYRLADDDLKPVSSPTDAFLTNLDFEHTTFLAAVDSSTKAPEVLIDSAYRGALSYAFARAVEGAADQKGDGQVTLRELFGYVRKVVYQLSDERQNIVTSNAPDRDLDREVVMQVGERGEARPGRPAGKAPVTAVGAAKPVRLATATVRTGLFTGLEALQVPFEIVALNAAPDLIYDPVAREAIAGEDKVALGVGLQDLPGVIDRTAAVRDLKALVVQSPQAVRVLPDASLHRQGTRVDVEVGDLEGRNLVLLDITGSGLVQMLYPLGNAGSGAPSQPGERFHVPFTVRDPYGADQVLAITTAQPIRELVAALRELDKRRSAGRLVEVIRRFKLADARLGLVGLFTVP